jgi:hypothetical protein
MALLTAGSGFAADKRLNIVILMTDDTGWTDFGVYSGAVPGLGRPTPNIDKITRNAGARDRTRASDGRLRDGNVRISCLGLALATNTLITGATHAS